MQFLHGLPDGWESVGLCHPLEQHCTAAAADQAAHPVAQDTVLLEGDDPLAVLPTQPKVVTAAVAAALDRQLVCGHPCSSLRSSL